jgi:hypothetical protein
MTTPFTVALLTTELNTDPAAMGYASLITAKIPDPIVSLINSTTSPGAASVTAAGVQPGGSFSITRFQMMNALAVPIYGKMAGAGVIAKAAQWAAVFTYVFPLYDTFDLTQANMTTMLAQMVTDGLLTSGQSTAITSRTGSRAEVLWGAGCVVTRQQVNQALGWTGS